MREITVKVFVDGEEIEPPQQAAQIVACEGQAHERAKLEGRLEQLDELLAEHDAGYRRGPVKALDPLMLRAKAGKLREQLNSTTY